MSKENQESGSPKYGFLGVEIIIAYINGIAKQRSEASTTKEKLLVNLRYGEMLMLWVIALPAWLGDKLEESEKKKKT